MEIQFHISPLSRGQKFNSTTNVFHGITSMFTSLLRGQTQRRTRYSPLPAVQQSPSFGRQIKNKIFAYSDGTAKSLFLEANKLKPKLGSFSSPFPLEHRRASFAIPDEKAVGFWQEATSSSMRFPKVPSFPRPTLVRDGGLESNYCSKRATGEFKKIAPFKAI